ncbi:MAG: glycerol-3-phosphate dehydrogenase [Deltaproteobacteria bacterium]|nr:glycerol-3-phosphate dehydrogenase [Deltaproteobacteria bacterium]
MPKRAEMWERLSSQVDLLVIGGGITGTGVARDGARRGLRVALVEQDDLASGTSSRSSKLVHGGLRYLEHYEFSLVFEAVSERRILMDIAPHLVNPLAFLFPVYKDSRRNLWFIKTGMWIYEGLSLFRSPKLHENLSPAELREREPGLRQRELTGAPLYYDCATDDARLTLETAMDATRAGAVVVTRARVTSLLRDEGGRVCGAVVEDTLSGERKEVRAHVVINATGPWTDGVRAMGAQAAPAPLLRPTKGVHIVVDAGRLPLQHAVVCFHPDDGRALFAIPWGDRSYVGTTDTDYDGPLDDLAATGEDVDYLLRAMGSYFPDAALQRADVISTWAGLRPLIAPPSGDAADESAVSREHHIEVGRDGLISIAGGKLTTYRRMSGEVVDTAVKLLRLSSGLPAKLLAPETDTEPLPGAVGWPSDDDAERVARRILDVGTPHIAQDTALWLANTYGTRGVELARWVRRDPSLAARLVEGRPEILAAVDWAVEEECATRLEDVMLRRTQLYYRDLDQGLGALDAVSERMAALLGWDAARRAEEVAIYRAEVTRSRRWKQRP